MSKLLVARLFTLVAFGVPLAQRKGEIMLAQMSRLPVVELEPNLSLLYDGGARLSFILLFITTYIE